MRLDDRTFLDAISSSPDDDNPRLLYADFLDEKGDLASTALAEFIRVQCAIEAMNPADVSKALQNREAELLTDHWRSWLRPACQALAEPLPSSSGHSPARYALEWFPGVDRTRHRIVQGLARAEFPFFQSCQFRRGFLAHASLVAKQYRSRQHVARLWERLPLDGLTLIEFSTAETTGSFGLMDAGRLRYLEIGDTSDDIVTAIAENPQLASLRELSFQWIRGEGDICEILRRSPFLRLRSLVLIYCNFQYENLIRLLRSDVTMQLKRLVICMCGFDDHHASRLVREFPTDRRIQHLDLWENPMSTRGAQLIEERFGDAVKHIDEDDHSLPLRYHR